MIKIIITIVISIISILIVLFIISAELWVKKPYSCGTWFFHNILKWHLPVDWSLSYGGYQISKCRFCGKEIIKVGYGDWFEC